MFGYILHVLYKKKKNPEELKQVQIKKGSSYMWISVMVSICDKKKLIWWWTG